MSNILQYSINIAMETTLLMVFVIIIVTFFLQKNNFKTTPPFIALSCCIILLTIVQIATWMLLIIDTTDAYRTVFMRILYILDYVFSYGITVAFYYYVEALAIDRYKQLGIVLEPNNKVRTIIITWGVVTTIIYSAGLFVPALYQLLYGQGAYRVIAYILLHIVAKFAFVFTLIFIHRHRKVIGKHECGMSIAFILVITLLVVVDELCEVCVGHVVMALFAFVIYVSIDLHKGLMLERQEKEIVEWKTQIMLSQMQPHFIYNVLTTISSMCEMQNAGEAKDVVNHFADYFRTNLDSLGKEKTILFEKELEHIKTYLWLEKVRFEDYLNIRYEIETTDFVVPSLTIQPIVENAVKHGIHPKEDAGTVTIRTYETSLDYVIIVEDDGVGFDVNEKKNDIRTHVGLDNVSKRLELICNGTCEIQSEIGKGTIVTIHIPKGE